MVEEAAINTTMEHTAKENLDSPQKIREAMAETRASLTYRLGVLEEEVERRVLDTFDQVNRRIIETSDQISGHITKPIQELQNRVHRVQEKVKSSPYKSLTISAVTGVFVGAWLGVRQKQRRIHFEQVPLDSVPRPRIQYQNRPSPWKDMVSTMALQLVQQLIQSGVTEISRRRDETRRK